MLWNLKWIQCARRSHAKSGIGLEAEPIDYVQNPSRYFLMIINWAKSDCLFFIKMLSKIYFYSCVFVWIYGMCMGSWGGQQRVLAPLVLELQTHVNHLTQVLEIELGSADRVRGVLTSWAISTILKIITYAKRKTVYMFHHEDEQATCINENLCVV